MVDIDIPGSRIRHNWGCLVCSIAILDDREYLMNEYNITEEVLKLFGEALEYFDLDGDEFDVEF
jgi:hypothetical protein